MSILRRTLLDLDFSRPTSRALARAQGRVVFRHCERLGRVYAGGFVHVVAEGRVILEDGVFFLPGMLTSSVVCLAGGELHVGYGAGFNYGVSIECVEYVDIGRGCMFGSLVRIADRNATRRGPIVIGDDVWIGHGAVIEPGVTIGSGSAVSAGSVVRSDVPPGKLAIGNPARCMPLDLVTKHDSMPPPAPLPRSSR